MLTIKLRAGVYIQQLDLNILEISIASRVTRAFRWNRNVVIDWKTSLQKFLFLVFTKTIIIVDIGDYN